MQLPDRQSSLFFFFVFLDNNLATRLTYMLFTGIPPPFFSVVPWNYRDSEVCQVYLNYALCLPCIYFFGNNGEIGLGKREKKTHTERKNKSCVDKMTQASGAWSP